MAHDVFISFSFKDQEKVDKITNHLTTIYNIPCWICTEEIRAGKSFYREIIDAIGTCKLFLLVQTKASAESREVGDEVFEAIAQNKTIIPFIIEDSVLDQEMEFKLRRTHHIDGTKDPLDDRIKELAVELCKILGRPFSENSKIESDSFDKDLLSSTIVELAADDIFVGREDLMEEIHTAFERHNTLFLQGMGGIGKSELAKQYYYKNKKTASQGCYDKVVFARYDGNFAALMADDFVFNIRGTARKTKNVNGKDEQQSDEEYARDKIGILKRICDRNTLIIIDNFDTEAETEPLFARFVDKAPYRVLVTTRNPQEGYKTISVKELDDESLKNVFLQYYGSDRGNKIVNGPDFDKLLDWSARHTLTIELLAKHMKRSAVRIPTVRQMLTNLNDRHLNENLLGNAYDRIKQILRLSELGEEETYFLRCLALMPAAGIDYVDHFEKWIRGEKDSEYYWDDVLYKLSELSIVRNAKDDSLICLHPIIREVIINELKPDYESCKEFIDRCAMVGEDYLPQMYRLPFTEKALLLECYTSILNFMPIITNDTYQVYVNISYMYHCVGSYTQTIELQQRIYDYACELFGVDSDEAMLVSYYIGRKNYYFEYYDRALTYYTPAADWFYKQEKCYAKSREGHAVIKHCAQNYCMLYRRTKNTSSRDSALEYTKKSEEYGKRLLSATAFASEDFLTNLIYQINTTCSNYIEIYLEDQNFDMAAKYLQEYLRAIQVYSKDSAIPHPNMADYYCFLSQLQNEKGDFAKAAVSLSEAYKILLIYFSNQNSRVVRVLKDLTICYSQLKDYKKAKEYLSEAIESAAAIYTEDHPKLAELYEIQREIDTKIKQ